MKRLNAHLMDFGMCGMMDLLQRRHRLSEKCHVTFESYLAEHEFKTRDQFFQGPEIHEPESPILRWQSPVTSPFAENNTCSVDLFPCEKGWQQPTVIMLHALMSASDRGYRGWARRFNERGWNAAFVHLPYHYSRKPRGRWNGELAITADVVRTVEALRAGVTEIRQLMQWMRRKGCPSFGLWACSYGGWIGSLLASVEADFAWTAFIEPILNVEHSIWVSPAGRAIRRELLRSKINRPLIERYFPLASPLHGKPLCAGERIVFGGGLYDSIAPLAEIKTAQLQWGGTLITAPQGHFGYQLMQKIWEHLETHGMLTNSSRPL